MNQAADPKCSTCNIRTRSYDAETGGFFSSCVACAGRQAVAPWCGCEDRKRRERGDIGGPMNHHMVPVVVNDAVIGYQCGGCGDTIHATVS